jgi:ferrochelatase
MSAKTAILLLQMGGPDSLDAVEPFLLNLFADRDIIRIGPAFLQPLISRFIVKRRAPKSEACYARIGGKSPIRELTELQARALEELLGPEFRCFVAMRYWKPSTTEALAAIKREGISRVIALSLYPHYSRATTGSSVNELKRVLGEAGVKFDVSFIDRFYDHPLYIEALTERIEQGLARFPERDVVHLLFSAHSLPQSFIEEGDPYLDHILTTVRLVMDRLGALEYHLAFQSRAGPVKWLEPSTEEMLQLLGDGGCQNLLMIPISFVSDHIETLYEIDIQYAEEAEELGIENFQRPPSLNDSPLFIQCLADLVNKVVRGEE